MATQNNNLSDYDKSNLPNVSNMRFGIVVSQWNDDITDGLYKGAYNTLLDCGVSEDNIIKVRSPWKF